MSESRYRLPDVDKGKRTRWIGLALVGAVVASLVVAWGGSLVAQWVLGPPLHNDLQTYATMKEAVQSGRFDKIRLASLQVQESASDPELRKVAGVFMRAAKYHQEAGIDTVEEAESWSGKARMMRHMMSGVITMVEGGIIGSEATGWYLDGIALRVEEKYEPLLEQAERARLWAERVFWTIFPLVFLLSISIGWYFLADESPAKATVESAVRATCIPSTARQWMGIQLGLCIGGAIALLICVSTAFWRETVVEEGILWNTEKEVLSFHWTFFLWRLLWIGPLCLIIGAVTGAIVGRHGTKS